MLYGPVFFKGDSLSLERLWYMVATTITAIQLTKALYSLIVVKVGTEEKGAERF